ncbi:hypothetical protein ACQ4M3_09640 [Leptolyngbya sp. AN03gr2]|uniref:hypothetical protein n=1 Tax=Leptolyngbya sp. AN03gr2 TaxID=3423364 RepID=UPI003D32028F
MLNSIDLSNLGLVCQEVKTLHVCNCSAGLLDAAYDYSEAAKVSVVIDLVDLTEPTGHDTLDEIIRRAVEAGYQTLILSP